MAVITPDRGRVLPHVHLHDRRRPGGLLGTVAVVLLVAAAALGVARLGDLLPDLRNPFATETVDRTGPAVLKALADLHEYRAASGSYQVIVDLERDAKYLPPSLKGERTLFVGVGSVDASVDFGGISPASVQMSPDRRSVTVTLPRAQLSEARIDPGRSYVYERRRGLLDRLGAVFSDNPASERELFVLTEQRLEAAAAAEPGLVVRAEENTRTMLEGLLGTLGFTQVVVNFE